MFHVSPSISITFWYIGYISASLSSIFLDKRQVFGDYERFLEEYKDAITVDVKEKIERLNQLSENNSAIDFKGIL